MQHAHSHEHHRSEGHAQGKHAGHSPEMFRRRFWLSLLLTAPILVFGHMIADLLGYHPPSFRGSYWIAPALGTFVFFYGGGPFLQGAVRELRERRPGMMTLVSLAISVAFAFSAAVLLGLPGMALWEELATLVTIMLLGHWMEMRSITQAKGALSELARLLPSTATRLTGTETEEVPTAELRTGDVVLVRPGESVPADGVVRDGRSALSEAMITGESRPVDKAPGAKVIAGTVNGSGSLRVEVTGAGEETALSGIMRLVADAQQSRSRGQALADRAAALLTYVAIGAGTATLIAWLAMRDDWSYAVERTVATLVIACPHALGLAIPLVVAISTTIGARSGLLVRDRRGLEEARELDVVVFDKTGTLTRGEFRVVRIVTANGMAESEALRVAAAVEHDSEHAIAQGIVGTARERGIQFGPADEFEAIPGQGVRGRLQGRNFHMGGPALLRELGVVLPEPLAGAEREAAERGQAVVHLLENDHVLATFAVADAVRPESRDAVRQLRAAGIQVIMITGDARAVADAVARELGIDTVFAEVQPQQKAAKIRELRENGVRVAMVGDGVNDAPALVEADVGVAIGAGTDVAVEAGDVVLMRSDPNDVVRILRLSKASYRKMVQNLWWAAGYNIVAIPLAAGVLASRGLVLEPAVGAVLMSASTIVVAVNAQLLRRVQL